MIYDITGICMASLQYGFSYVFSDERLGQTISDITGICMASLQYGISCDALDYRLEQMTYDITDMRLAPLQFGFSCLLSVDDHDCYEQVHVVSDIAGTSMI